MWCGSSPEARLAFRAHARRCFGTASMTEDDARVLLDLYDAVPSPNFLDCLWLRLCTHKAAKSTDRQRQDMCYIKK